MYFDAKWFWNEVADFIVGYCWGMLAEVFVERCPPKSILDILIVVLIPFVLPIWFIYNLIFGIIIFPFFFLSKIKFGKQIRGGGGIAPF